MPEGELTAAEVDRFRELESELLELFYPEDRRVQRIFQFDAGPVIVICPTLQPTCRARSGTYRTATSPSCGGTATWMR